MSNIKKCDACGAVIKNKLDFCEHCGAKLFFENLDEKLKNNNQTIYEKNSSENKILNSEKVDEKNSSEIKDEKETKDIEVKVSTNKKTKKTFKELMKSLNIKWYEIVFLICDVTVVVSLFAFSKEKNYLSFSCSFVGCFAIISLAKGLFFAPKINVIYDILYIILSFSQRYFGEAIIYLCMTLPIDFYSSFAWGKNKSGESDIIKINKLGKKEWSFFWSGTIIFTFVFYFILKALNTSELIISTISFITSAMAGYFLIRRSQYYSLAYACNDLILISLWSMSLINYGISYLPVVINFCCSFTIDTYGFINLQKEIKKQNKKLIAEQNNLNAEQIN